MSAGGQGQGKNLCCFQAPLKSMRRVLAAPGSSPSLPGPHAGPERSRNTRRVPVMYTERTTARRRRWVPRGKRRASLTISTLRTAYRKHLHSRGPRGSLGLRHLNGLPGALREQEHRPGPLPSAALQQEVPTAIPAQQS